MEGLLLLILLLAVISLPAVIAIARGKPAASIAMLIAWCFGCPVIGWFVGMWLVLDD
jgi:uncharacterized protein with PQ loop repeat